MAIHLGRDFVFGERIELLDEDDRRRILRTALPLGLEFVADFPSAEQHARPPSRRLGPESRCGIARSARSASGEDAAGFRSMLLGVNTTSGFRQLRSAWRRSR